jgi:glutamate synthase (NADPH/NADH) small chain
LQTTSLEGVDGRLVALHAVEVDARLHEVPGTAVRLEVDVLLLAMGFVGPEAKPLVDAFGIELDARGNVKVDQHFATSVPGLFGAGDAMRGASLIVWAIADGREAAKAIDSRLR